MSKQIKFLVETVDAPDLIIDLIEIDDLDVQFEENSITQLDESKRHGLYSLDAPILTPILIIIPSIITSITGLAKVIFDYKIKKAQKEPSRKKTTKPKEVSIVIDDKAIPLSEFTTVEELTKFLIEKTKK